MSVIPIDPEQGTEPLPNPTPNPEDAISAVYIIDGGWLVVLESGAMFTTDTPTDFEDYPGEPIPLPAPLPMNLTPPHIKAIGGEISGNFVGVVVLTT